MDDLASRLIITRSDGISHHRVAADSIVNGLANHARTINVGSVDMRKLRDDQARIDEGHWDAGYCSAANLEHTTTLEAAHQTEFFISTRRMKHGAPAPMLRRARFPPTRPRPIGWRGG